MSSPYGQLARMPNAFTVKTSQVVISAISTVKIATINPLRVYISFSFTPVAGDVLIPQNVDGNSIGYLLSATVQEQEFWIEKHKVMVTNEWKYSRASAVSLTIMIKEILYSSPVEE